METHRVCQPRAYSPLHAKFVENIRRHDPDKHIVVDHAVVHRIETRNRQGSRMRALRLVTCEESSAWCPYCAAMFGNHHPTLRSEFFDVVTPFSGNTTSAFIDLAAEYARDWQQSWLDVTGHELSTMISNGGWLCPTVVLVQSPASDFSLFWNLRIVSTTTVPAWIIPIPFEGATDPAVLDALKNWLLAFLHYGQNPNYCLVTSNSIKEEECRTFCEQFQKSLSGTPIEFVDYEPPKNRIPTVIPYEYSKPWPVEISNRKLTIQPPRPKAFEPLGSSEAWFVDLCKDVKTGRAIGELQLPPSPVICEVLNGPCPPVFSQAIIPRTGDGSDCINICCSGGKEVVNIYLPTSERILGEILRKIEAEPIPDEKRSSYLPVIDRFGGIFLAASALSGQRGTILTDLAEKPKQSQKYRASAVLVMGNSQGRVTSSGSNRCYGANQNE